MRIALFWKFLSMSLAAAALLVASGCSNCGAPKCASVAQDCEVAGTVSYRPDLYKTLACQDPEASRKTAEALEKAICETPAKAAAKEDAKTAAPAAPADKSVVLPPVMPGEKAAAKADPGCLVPADTPLADKEVAAYIKSEHFDIAEPEFVGEPLPPMPTFPGQWTAEPPVDPAS